MHVEVDGHGIAPREFPSRRFWVLLSVSLSLLAAGLGWLFAGLNYWVGSVLIVSGALTAARLIIERWRFDHEYGPFADWRPSRRVYLVPIAGFCGGLLLIFTIPGHTSVWIGVGVWLASLCVVAAGVLAVRRAMLNTKPD